MDALLNSYSQLNQSFRKKKLVYRLGQVAGFFSEYNNMILAMLYCLENQIRFVLASKDATFRYHRGWADYFQPFCREDWLPYQRHNPRVTTVSKARDPRTILHHLLRPRTFLTYELWDAFRDKGREQKHFYIPALGIDGDLLEACRVLVRLTWKYNAATQAVVDRIMAGVQLPEDYIGLHIRSGDKSRETALLHVREYVEKARSLSPLRTFFVLTDDYGMIEEMHDCYPDVAIHTLCRPDERGYVHETFCRQDKILRREALWKLFASVELLGRAQFFIGTYTANPGMFLGMRMPKGRCISLDADNQWQIL
jgi:hypothetical protein